MTISKKLIGSLLGGGLSIVFASFGGIKLNDTIGYYKKVNYYATISKNWKDRSPDEFKREGYYLPNWEDDRVWAEAHDALKDKYKSLNPHSTYPTPESFRDYCYKKAEEDKMLKNCNTTDGWCEECVRKRKWDSKE